MAHWKIAALVVFSSAAQAQNLPEPAFAAPVVGRSQRVTVKLLNEVTPPCVSLAQGDYSILVPEKTWNAWTQAGVLATLHPLQPSQSWAAITQITAQRVAQLNRRVSARQDQFGCRPVQLDAAQTSQERTEAVAHLLETGGVALKETVTAKNVSEITVAYQSYQVMGMRTYTAPGASFSLFLSWFIQ